MLYSNYISLKRGGNKQVSREASHRKAFRQRPEGGTREHHLDSGDGARESSQKRECARHIRAAGKPAWLGRGQEM